MEVLPLSTSTRSAGGIAPHSIGRVAEIPDGALVHSSVVQRLKIMALSTAPKKSSWQI